MTNEENTRTPVVPPLPHLAGTPAPGKEPTVVRDARLINGLSLTLCVFGTLVMGITLVRGSDKGNVLSGFLLYVGLGALSLWLIRALKQGNPVAWSVQRILSILGLLGFPLGTLIHGLILAKWFKPETKAWFGIG